ncbi:MAG: ABC transporter ATP-binding protein [Methanomassiliicoccaceae archaeon]|jgi:iron complex transport system ATP-binding protein|nr:ABC transporter ATP-binding protein [Euryarchaeota archaeon]HOB37598.1 ABC transporter ATP-binding protein [Methanomassiliicoccaceae archaeon]HOQ25501.1 ABC transporter ATP-binding protein [Methanomassiliicoccaceae archaeon]HPP44716.1 ABC transporter ATP-binding protein [Methanomassiliicoccaceae archaeon]HQD87479.1 ABC transporter ATP-binding protein [Methanomassiliicoccaceae archaeon]
MMLSVEDLKFSYGDDLVLDGITFDVNEGEIISILGPNGAGKTTLLKSMCNIHRPQEGRIMVDGKDVLSMNRRDLAKYIGYVPQSSPASRITVFDSVLVGRRPYIEIGVTMKDIDMVSEIIDSLGLSHLSLRYLTQISGGELQKASIARAIVQQPKVLVLDEPTSSLDISNQHRTMHMIEDIVRSRNMCTIMTMHDINLATHYSDRFLFLSNGKAVAYGGIEVIDEQLIKEVYGFDAEIIDHNGSPLVVPKTSGRCCHRSDHTHPHDIHDHLDSEMFT